MIVANSVLLHISSPTTFSHTPNQSIFKPALLAALKGMSDVTLHKDGAGILERIDFPFKHYQEVIRAVSKHQPDLKVVPIPSATLAAMQHALGVKLPPQEQLLKMVPEPMLSNLYDYQKEGVAFAVAHGGKVLLADEMGVGKSRQGLALLAVYRFEWPCLIVCPSSLKGQWVKWAVEFLVPLLETPDCKARYATFLSAPGKLAVKQAHKKTDLLDGLVNVISYDLAGTKQEELESRAFQVALLDESHYIKSRTAKRVQVLLPILSKCKRVILMSGTPSLNKPSELFPQVHLLRRDVFSTFHAFGDRYCDAKRDRFGWSYDGHSNLQELNIVLETLCMIRRTKSEVLELPPKTRERVSLKMTAEQLELIQKGVDHFRKIEAQDKDPVTVKSAFMTLWRDVGKIKLPSIIEYINDLLEQEEKFLVFFHHRMLIDEADAFLTKKKVKFIRIDGMTKPQHRTAMVETFQEDDECRVALLSITAAGSGLHMTASHIAVFAEVYFTSGSLMQAEDRIHRIGQSCPVSIRYLLAEGTVDEQVWWILMRKVNVIGQIMGEADAKMAAKRVEYDEEITQVDIREFIATICGKPSTAVATMEAVEAVSSAPVTAIAAVKRVEKKGQGIIPFKPIRGPVDIASPVASVPKMVPFLLEERVPKKAKTIVNTAPPNWKPPS